MGLLVQIFGTNVIAGVCALIKYSRWMKCLVTHLQLLVADNGADTLRLDCYGVCVCVCAVFVLSRDDYHHSLCFSLIWFIPVNLSI